MRYAFIVAALLLAACAGDSEAPEQDTAPTVEQPAQEPSLQQAYDGWLDLTRGFVAADAGLNCKPTTWDYLSADIDPVDATLFTLAISDACKEAGMIPYPGDFSAYYPD
jgi:hypothetical protein